MEDAINDIRSELQMLRTVTATLWANFLANGGGDPLANCQRAEMGMLESLAAAVAQIDHPNLRDVTEPFHQKLEEFWRRVEDQVAEHPNVATRRS